MTITPPDSRVVYERCIHGRSRACQAVSGPAEWEALEADSPGAYTLIQAGIINEGGAERLARTPHRGERG
jgi:hypothetical protein